MFSVCKETAFRQTDRVGSTGITGKLTIRGRRVHKKKYIQYNILCVCIVRYVYFYNK